MRSPVDVEARDPRKKNSPLAGPVEDEATVMLDTAVRVCVWNGREFGDGEVVAAGDARYECSFGQWVRQA
ncbi:MAG: hypothetical protein H6983_24665 [Ectothiorhodospiraceae bacterium]|nr:hypothetical protein [Chromatiales bacterium]MCP5157393.1 hypothetical protein [Ectothiorhodospiraceae bacterium]